MLVQNLGSSLVTWLYDNYSVCWYVLLWLAAVCVYLWVYVLVVEYEYESTFVCVCLRRITSTHGREGGEEWV